MKLTGGLLLLVAVLAGLLAFVAWGFTAAWKLGGDSAVSIHGYIAMALAAVFTLALGGGLMWLAFYSARQGWDDIDREV